MLSCPSCGGILRFEPHLQRIYCDNCRSNFAPEDYPNIKVAVEEKEISLERSYDESADYDVIRYTCPQCGGTILSYDDTAATFCSYCGSNAFIKGNLSQEKKPDTIIPFKLTKEDCEKKYRDSLTMKIFAPSKFKSSVTIDRFRGIYMPYWVYDFDINNKRLALTGSTETRNGDFITKKEYALSGTLDAHYAGISFDAASKFSDNLSMAIAPFNYKDATGFVPSYLLGFYADSGDVSHSTYSGDALNMAVDDLTTEFKRKPGFLGYGVSDTSQVTNALREQRTKPKIGMFPVWFLSTKVGKRISYAVVNGQTGKVAADIPVSPFKYLVWSLLLAIPLFLIFSSFCVLNPGRVLTLSLILTIASWVISSCQLRELYKRNHSLDDRGLQSMDAKHPHVTLVPNKVESSIAAGFFIFFGALLLMPFLGWITLIIALVICNALNSNSYKIKDTITGKVIKPKIPLKEKLPSYLKLGISVAASVIILFWTPVQDTIYYAGAALCIIMTILTYIDIIGQHNKLTTRELPQFNVRGGDRNA
jgi:DNA-directed RNA polymerase subunit RPC12/RpoP